jgi:type 1 glutamine amidotransferase
MLSLLAAIALAQQTPIPQAPATEPGATLRLFDIQRPMTDLAPLTPGQTPNIDRLVGRIDFSEGEFFGFKDHFVIEITGEIYAAEEGDYRFRLSSDDGTALQIGGRLVLDNDGVHAATPKEASVRLKAGWHPFLLRYFENDGGERLLWEWRGPKANDFSVVDQAILRTPAGVTRVVSPGPKKVVGIGGPTRPGNGEPLDRVHPGWEVSTIRPLGFEPKVGALGFLPDGRMLITTFEPNQSAQFRPDQRDGALWVLDNVTSGDRSKVTAKKIADNLQEPLGLAVVGSDIYVSQRQEITRLRDTNGDDLIDVRETVGSGWKSDNYHHFTFGLVEKDGWLYGTLSTSIHFNAPGIDGPNPANRGSVFRVDPKRYDPKQPAKNIEYLTSGHRTPNGIGVGPKGEIFVGENQGAWQPANKLNHIRVGGFYGHYNDTKFKTPNYPDGGVPGLFDHRPFTPPALYMPQNEAANSPSQPILIPSGPFAGQMYVSDVTYGGLHRAFLEEVDGQWQGGMVHVTQGLESGTNRLAWGPDGSLYYGGIGAAGNWGWTNPKTGKVTTFGLQRLRPTGKTVFEIHQVKATPDGFVVEFTKPVDRRALTKRDNYVVRQWNYAPTIDYGGDKKNRESLTVARMLPAKDGKSVRLVVPGLKEDRVVYLNLNLKSATGEPLWVTEAWYTLNKRPRPQTAAKKVTRPMNVLVFSRTTGFRHDSIGPGSEAIRNLATAKGFHADFSEDASVFTPEGLAKYDVILFLSTTGDILNESQQSAMQGFIRGGGGFVGVHAASDTEYSWPWFGQLVGAYFQSHPHIQEADIHVEDTDHPTTKMLPKIWRRVDEWYDYRSNPRGKVRVLATLDEKSYSGGKMGGDHPIIWCHEMDGGRAWYTGLGHTADTFKEELFLQSLYEGIRWAAELKAKAK